MTPGIDQAHLHQWAVREKVKTPHLGVIIARGICDTSYEQRPPRITGQESTGRTHFPQSNNRTETGFYYYESHPITGFWPQWVSARSIPSHPIISGEGVRLSWHLVCISDRASESPEESVANWNVWAVTSHRAGPCKWMADEKRSSAIFLMK